MERFVYAKSSALRRAMQMGCGFFGLVFLGLARGFARVVHGNATMALAFAGFGIACWICVAILRKDPPSDFAPADAVMAIDWDSRGITVTDGPAKQNYPWIAVGRIDFETFRDRYNHAKVSSTLMIDVYVDGRIKALEFDSASLNSGTRSVADIIREMNDLHERALLAARRAA